MRTFLSLAFLLLFAAAVSSQEPVERQTIVSGGNQPITCRINISAPHVNAVGPKPTAPYSATEQSSWVQTLADGTHITQTQRTQNVYRDSQGRTRREQNLCGGRSDDPSAIFVVIRDPVDGVGYILDLQKQIAYRFTAESHSTSAPAPPQATPSTVTSGTVSVSVFGTGSSGTVFSGPAAPPVGSPAIPRETPESEPLGTQVIEGVTVEGTRVTRTIPLNAEGNDRPLQIVEERWVSPDLQLVVLTKHNDPRSGEHTFRLTNISLSEPDLALFRPPADFKIVDATSGTVTLEYLR